MREKGEREGSKQARERENKHANFINSSGGHNKVAYYVAAAAAMVASRRCAYDRARPNYANNYLTGPTC